MRRKPTTVFVYLLGAYVLIQFVWWGYHLIELTKSSRMTDATIAKRVVMIIGEGSVFLVLLLLGLWKIKSSIKKEIRIAQQQNNFMLSVTHELKTPIAATKLYLQTLIKRQLEGEKRSELMLKAIDETNRLELLVEQILTASRLEQQAFSLHKDQFLLQPFLNDLIAIQEKRITLPITILPFADRLIKTDRLVFTTILNNLIENAQKYGQSDKGIVLNIQPNESDFTISVRDFGKGIPIEQQKHIFDKFVRLENEETRSNKGTGLGLYIAYECTRALGGNLRLLPNETVGACFEIQLPYE